MDGVIEIGVYGGMVQWVRGIPSNVEVRVHDYDIDGVDPEAIASDGEGNPCVVAIYEGHDDDLHLLEAME